MDTTMGQSSISGQSTEVDIRVLNSLIATTLDSVDGYQEASNDASNQQFKSMFMDRASERREVASQLKARVRELGGEPEDDGTLLAGAHRGFMNLRNAVMGSDDTAIVAEVERGEDHIKAKFDEAMADTTLSTETKSLIQGCYSSVRQGHDQMRDLKHGMENTASM